MTWVKPRTILRRNGVRLGREKTMGKRKIVIMGAAGRDFHNFNCLARNRDDLEVVAFTATQIPEIDSRRYPAALAGPCYPDGIPVYGQAQLPRLIIENAVDEVWFSYSDVSHQEVMVLASRVTAWGARFVLCDTAETMLKSERPVIAVTASRTGAGKSQTSRFIADRLRRCAKHAVALRHPMPYGDLEKQACQRFESLDDLVSQECTIGEREELEPYIDEGLVVYAGVDCERTLRQAEAEADVILWDGGNNDTPFVRPDLHLLVVDPHRAGHETTYFPGFTNLLLANAIIVNKIGTADPHDIKRVAATCREHNPDAMIIPCDSVIEIEDESMIRGRKVLVVEDGPTLTHGGMGIGAGWYAAKRAGAAEIVDPRPHAVGSLASTFEAFPQTTGVLPAMGYSATQIRELEQTIEATDCDVVVVGTPVDLTRILETGKPMCRVRYRLEEQEPGRIVALIRSVVGL